MPRASCPTPTALVKEDARKTNGSAAANEKKGGEPTPVVFYKLEERLKVVDVDVVLVHPDRPHQKYKNSTDYLIDRLFK